MSQSNNDKRKAMRNIDENSKRTLATVEKVSSSLSNQLTDEKNANFSRLMLFYVTYGYGTNLAKKYSVVQADDMEEARELVHAAIGPAYSFIYSEDTFKGQVEEYCLEEVPLQPHRSLRGD